MSRVRSYVRSLILVICMLPVLHSCTTGQVQKPAVLTGEKPFYFVLRDGTEVHMAKEPDWKAERFKRITIDGTLYDTLSFRHMFTKYGLHGLLYVPDNPPRIWKWLPCVSQGKVNIYRQRIQTDGMGGSTPEQLYYDYYHKSENLILIKTYEQLEELIRESPAAVAALQKEYPKKKLWKNQNWWALKPVFDLFNHEVR